MKKMAKSVATRGRVAAISNSGDMITGVFEPGWEALPGDRKGMVLQFGSPIKKFGLPTNSWKFIAAHIGIEVAETITVDSKEKGSLLCGVKGQNESSGRGWYDIEGVIEDLPESCELMILNRTEEPSDQSGITKHLSLLQRSSIIAVTGIEDPEQHGLALRISQICRGFIRMDTVVFGKGIKRTVAIIEPAPSVKTPSPMRYPSIAKILPKKLSIESPIGIANDYGHISKIVEERYAEWTPEIKISIEICP